MGEPVEIVIEDDGVEESPPSTPIPPLNNHSIQETQRNSVNNNNNNNIILPNGENIAVFQTELVLTNPILTENQSQGVCITAPSLFLHPGATFHSVNLTTNINNTTNNNNSISLN